MKKICFLVLGYSGGGLCIFRGKKVISAQREAGIVHFWRKKGISAKSISIKKMHRNGDWNSDGADIMFCEVLFDRITLVCYYGRVMRWQGSEMPPKW